MCKQMVIFFGLILSIIFSNIAVMADSTIYTDGLGRMHFLGRDAANNTGVQSNYSNSAEQDLTRKLYTQSANQTQNDTTYSQHPLKNYENTFPDSRYGTTNVWNTKYANNPEAATVKTNTKMTADTKKINVDDVYTNNTNFNNSTVKKHWWQKR